MYKYPHYKYLLKMEIKFHQKNVLQLYQMKKVQQNDHVLIKIMYIADLDHLLIWKRYIYPTHFFLHKTDFLFQQNVPK